MTPIFQWWVVKCGSMDYIHQRAILCLIKLNAQKLLTILGSIANIIWRGGTYMIINKKENLLFDMNKIFI